MLSKINYLDYFNKYITEAKEEDDTWDDEVAPDDKDKPAPVYIENYILS